MAKKDHKGKHKPAVATGAKYMIPEPRIMEQFWHEIQAQAAFAAPDSLASNGGVITKPPLDPASREIARRLRDVTTSFVNNRLPYARQRATSSGVTGWAGPLQLLYTWATDFVRQALAALNNPSATDVAPKDTNSILTWITSAALNAFDTLAPTLLPPGMPAPFSALLVAWLRAQIPGIIAAIYDNLTSSGNSPVPVAGT